MHHKIKTLIEELIVKNKRLFFVLSKFLLSQHMIKRVIALIKVRKVKHNLIIFVVVKVCVNKNLCQETAGIFLNCFLFSKIKKQYTIKFFEAIYKSLCYILFEVLKIYINKY